MVNNLGLKKREVPTIRYSTHEISRIGLFTALAVIMALIFRFGEAVVPFSPLPLIVMLAGLLIGPRPAATSMTLYLLLGLAGIPVFATPPYGGFSYVLSPSFGFLIGFIPAAYTVGYILKRKESQSLATYVLAAALGLTVIYAVGLPYLWAVLNLHLGQQVGLGQVLKIGLLPFLVPDIFKIILAVFITRAVERSL